jgi:PAS domain S-box-containing protein
MLDSSRRVLLYGLLGTLSLVFFGLDVALPAGLTVELLQVAIVLLTLFASGRGPTLVFGGIATAFVAAGYGAHLVRGEEATVLVNHGIVMGGLWTAVAVVLGYKHVLQSRHESEARAQAILETTVDGIITIDVEGTIESFNQAAEDIFGYDAEEVIGKNVKVLMPSPYREEHDEYLRSYHETGQRKIIGIGREVTGKRKDGSTFPMDLAVSEMDLGDRTIFTGIVRDISERRRLEKEILSVSEEERRRIGQDLHDGLGQMLTGIGLLSQALARQLEEEGHERADDMAEITEHIKEADQYARDLSHGLIPVDVEGGQPSALPEALRRLADNAERLFSVECSFRAVDAAIVLENTVATHLYRIAQEAVNNAVRHGEADHLRIVLAAGEEYLRLQVRDDGSGFEEEAATDAGMGVRIMNYRARIIGGSLDVSSTLGEGTVVTCTVPRTSVQSPETDAAASASA